MACTSHFTYKERVGIKSADSVEYNRLYTENQHGNVYERLTMDASARQGRNSARPAYPEGMGYRESNGSLSGFVSNTSRPPTSSSLASGFLEPVPVDKLDPMALARFKQREPIECLSAIRPGTSTTNQTLRMLGTYKSDDEWAKKMNVFIPSGCPAPKNKRFHPDVRM